MFSPDKLQRGFGDFEDREGERPRHLLHLLHHLPVGDLGPGLLEGGQLDRDIDPGDGLEIETLGSEQVHTVLGVPTGLDDGHFTTFNCPSEI